MTNTIRALQSAIDFIEEVHGRHGVTLLGEAVLTECKSALAEIEKCEPVGWTNEFQLSYLDDGDACRVYPDTTECPIPVFTSPPQREWVGLSDEHKTELLKEFFSNDHMFKWLLSTTETKLKQLNTKG